MIHDKINFVGNSELIFPVCVMVAQLTLDQFVEVQILNREPYGINTCKVLDFAGFLFFEVFYPYLTPTRSLSNKKPLIL